MRMRLSPYRLLALAALAFTVAGCAGSAGSSSGGTPRRSSSARLTAEELHTVAEIDLYSAIGRLRPTWLRPGTRGTLPQVVLDGAPQAGGVDVLRSMRAADATEVQYMNASDATTRFGTGYVAGAILVSTRR